MVQVTDHLLVVEVQEDQEEVLQDHLVVGLVIILQLVLLKEATADTDHKVLGVVE